MFKSSVGHIHSTQPKMEVVRKFPLSIWDDPESSNRDLIAQKLGPEHADFMVITASLGCDCCITRLSLFDNELGDVGASKLATALMRNTTLKCLVLCGNGIGDTGAKSLADLLLVNTTLDELRLSFNKNHMRRLARLDRSAEREHDFDPPAPQPHAPARREARSTWPFEHRGGTGAKHHADSATPLRHRYE